MGAVNSNQRGQRLLKVLFPILFYSGLLIIYYLLKKLRKMSNSVTSRIPRKNIAMEVKRPVLGKIEDRMKEVEDKTNGKICPARVVK